ncbi:MAG: efflux RND transporter periplasmic adaptor subunit [Rhodobacterales bacterium]|nr:efflux RND transporter periplasmic adaptor subunit [Rhodobacterales bacterium]
MSRRLVAGALLVVAVGVGAVALPGGRAMLAPWLPAFLQPEEAPAQKPAASAKKGPRAVPVRAAVAELRTVPIVLEGVGTVKARSTVAVKAQIEGQLIEALVREGQTVHKGDILFRLDARPLQARLKEAEAALARDRINHKKAVDDFDRLKLLSSKGYSPKTQSEDARTLVDTTSAAIRASEATVEFAHLNLNYATIRSPIDGRVGNILISVGNTVKANGDQPLLVITETKPVYVSFGLPERYIDAVKARMAESRLAVEVTTQASGSTAATGELFFINNEVNATTGTIELLAQFENADERLVPGQFARARVLLSNLDNAILVPTRAVQINQKGPYVWIVEDDGTVSLRAVTTGPEDREMTVIASGLEAGESVVTDGQLRLYTGAKVTLGDERKGGDRKGGDKKDGDRKGGDRKGAAMGKNEGGKRGKDDPS